VQTLKGDPNDRAVLEYIQQTFTGKPVVMKNEFAKFQDSMYVLASAPWILSPKFQDSMYVLASTPWILSP
jgi:hypothetical protein